MFIEICDHHVFCRVDVLFRYKSQIHRYNYKKNWLLPNTDEDWNGTDSKHSSDAFYIFVEVHEPPTNPTDPAQLDISPALLTV